MKIKKSVSLLLACMMFSSFAVACNGNGSGNTGDGGIGEYTGSGFGAAGSAAPETGFGGSGYVSGSVSGAGGSLGDYESAGSGSSGTTGGSGVGNYETIGTGGASGIMAGLGNPSTSEGNYAGGSGNGGSGDVSDFETSGSVDAPLTGGTGGSYEGQYQGGSSSSSNAGNYEAAGDGGASSIGGAQSGNLGNYEAPPAAYAGATELVDSEWRSQQGYNYFYYEQLGEDVMPIGAWCAPPATFGSFTTDQITTTNYRLAKAVGLNAVYGLYERAEAPGYDKVLQALDCAQRAGGIVYLVRDNNAYKTLQTYGPDAIDETFYDYMSHPAYGGTLFVDEPGALEFNNIGEGTANWKQHELFGETKLALVNNLPKYASAAQLYYGAGTTNSSIPAGVTNYNTNYEAWLELYMTEVQPQVFSYDFYPFNGVNNNVNAGYYEQLSLVRKVCMKYNVPFWNFAQVGSWSGTREFAKSEFGIQMHTALAYGAKGVQWFNFWQPYEMPAESVNGFVDHYGNPTTYFTYGKSVNDQIAAVDHVLLKSKSTGVIQIGNSFADGIPSRDAPTDKGYLTTATGTGDAIVGCFKYRDIGYAYYIASNSTTSGATITLNFNSTRSIETIQKTVSSTATANKATINLEAGEGVLVVVK